MNILIVDDSKTILNRLKTSIENELGLKVYTATSMKECADLILKHKGDFTLALLDYNLPDAQNGEIISFINKFKIPSILLTGSQLDKKDDIFKNENLIDYVLKNGSYAIDYTIAIVKRFILNAKIEILIIDDSKTFAAKMESLCKRYNLNTTVNYSAIDALETIKQRADIKIVLVDYMMPIMDGLQFTMELRKSYKKDEVAIIALSGTSEKEIVASFLKYGANDFLYKDFTNEEFIARVNNNIEVIELFDYTQDKSKKDPLTGLFNKRYLLEIGRDIYERAVQKKSLFATVMIEIDEFNVLCDSYGHEAGDEVLFHVAQILNKHLNKDSIVARFGAEQFCVLFKNRAYAEVIQVFEEIQNIIKNTPLKIDDNIHHITVSIGGNITFTESLENMIDLADETLCNLKHKKIEKVIINS
ncbi:MAG: diguanylate cyclase [Arcobacteraceae bacterium]|nr:diguanylate cyclase [Arcobacteraceae bacterium]